MNTHFVGFFTNLHGQLLPQCRVGLSQGKGGILPITVDGNFSFTNSELAGIEMNFAGISVAD
ncbi:MAG: Uncharacterised protein [Pseudidiomarina mangrovi]|nr:MAG: Uncharacterised protein [Pseudidiomarina mangrovi]